MNVRASPGVLAALLLVALQTIGCADSDSAHRRNEELMGSLPAFAQATLVRSYTSEPPAGPFLWYEFATDATPSAVVSFYRGALAQAGWQLVGAADRGMVFRNDGAEVNVFFWGHDPPAFQTAFAQVAPTPPRAAHSFMVRMRSS